MAASGLLMSSEVDTDEEEKKLDEIVERLKSSNEPIELKLEEMEDKELASQISMALAIFAMALELKKAVL